MSSSKFPIHRFKKPDELEVLFLINQLFGKSYTDSKPQLFEQSVLLVTRIDNKIVGFCAGNELENKKGLLDLLVVHPDFQRQGIGTSLFKARMSAFSTLQITRFILYHWVKKQRPKPYIAIAHGFKLKEILPNYWQRESSKIGYHCEECGPPPCKCTCHLYDKT
jgi:N-acetylglutamate synthase-like GNAT family acetyltransferase